MYRPVAIRWLDLDQAVVDYVGYPNVPAVRDVGFKFER
jgi:hypothetical protein